MHLLGVHDAVVAASAGQLRRLVLYGSRATGRARPDSDVDLIAFVEPPGALWNCSGRRAEEKRLRRAAGAAVAAAFGPTTRLDLVVRTLDEDAEAREVVGGVEHWAATTGLVLYEEAPNRPPVPQRQRADVVRDHTRSWLQFAARTLAHAEARATRGAAGGTAAAEALRFDIALAVRRACLAVCASFQLWDASASDRRAPLDALVGLFASAAPALAAEVHALLAAAPPSIEVGRRVLTVITAYLVHRDPELAVAPTSQRCRPDKASDLLVAPP